MGGEEGKKVTQRQKSVRNLSSLLLPSLVRREKPLHGLDLLVYEGNSSAMLLPVGRNDTQLGMITGCP